MKISATFSTLVAVLSLGVTACQFNTEMVDDDGEAGGAATAAAGSSNAGSGVAGTPSTTTVPEAPKATGGSPSATTTDPVVTPSTGGSSNAPATTDVTATGGAAPATTTAAPAATGGAPAVTTTSAPEAAGGAAQTTTAPAATGGAAPATTTETPAATGGTTSATTTAPPAATGGTPATTTTATCGTGGAPSSTTTSAPAATGGAPATTTTTDVSTGGTTSTTTAPAATGGTTSTTTVPTTTPVVKGSDPVKASVAGSTCTLEFSKEYTEANAKSIVMRGELSSCYKPGYPEDASGLTLVKNADGNYSYAFEASKLSVVPGAHEITYASVMEMYGVSFVIYSNFGRYKETLLAMTPDARKWVTCNWFDGEKDIPGFDPNKASCGLKVLAISNGSICQFMPAGNMEKLTQ